MSQLRKIKGDFVSISEFNPPRPATKAEIIRLNVHQKSAFQRAPDDKKYEALRWELIVNAVQRFQGVRGSATTAVKLLLSRAKDNDLQPYVLDALKEVAAGKRALPSRSTIFEKMAAYREQGLDGLLNKHKGCVRKELGWEAFALELYSLPSKPDYSAVHRRLAAMDLKCSYEQVKNYLKALPATMGQMSPARIGKHLYNQTEAKYIERCTTNLLAGDILMADGYRADVYLAHPVTGEIWRPEIMHVIDLKSRVLVGYRLMANEGSYDIMFGWAEIFARWNHVPPLLYVDNGSGYKNKLTELEDTSYYQRAGVQQVIHSIPRNPKGKGHVERYHRTVKDRFLKLWRPEFYCGTDMAEEVLQKTVREVKAGRMQLPSVQEFIAAYDAWLEEYNHDVHPEDKNLIKWDVWSKLQPIPPHASAQQIARPAEKRIVQRGAVQIHNRRYRHPDLLMWNHQEVVVEADVLNDAFVDIRTKKGELICSASVTEKIGVVSDSFMQDKRNQAELAAIKRKEKQIVEIKARNGIVIDADAIAENALAFEGDYTQIEDDEPPLMLDLNDLTD